MVVSSTLSSNADAGSLCSYQLRSDGVHEFIFHEASRAGVNQWTDQLVHILEASPHDAVVPIIVDTRFSSMLPIAYTIEKLRDVYLNCAGCPTMRLAFLSGNTALMLFVQMLAQMAASNEADRIQYHQSPTEADATAWLLAAQ